MVSARVRMAWALSQMGELRITHNGIQHRGHAVYICSGDVYRKSRNTFHGITIARHGRAMRHQWGFSDIWKEKTVIQIVACRFVRARLQYRNSYAPFKEGLVTSASVDTSSHIDMYKCQLGSYVYLQWATGIEPAFQTGPYT